VGAVTYLDTHVVFWLYAGGSGAPLTDRARAAIVDSADLRISPMVRLELQYLHELGRTGAPAAAIVDELAAVLGLRVCETPFPAVVAAAARWNWTRDPFDRLIVAQASLNGAPLVTKDRRIHERYAEAIW
jgi:PIN domain nuclease of toxin-antitoxin system